MFNAIIVDQKAHTSGSNNNDKMRQFICLYSSIILLKACTTLTTRYCNLRDGRRVERPLYALDTLIENPGDAISLYEDATVTNT